MALFDILLTDGVGYCDAFCIEKSVAWLPCVMSNVCFEISVINGTEISTVFDIVCIFNQLPVVAVAKTADLQVKSEEDVKHDLAAIKSKVCEGGNDNNNDR